MYRLDETNAEGRVINSHLIENKAIKYRLSREFSIEDDQIDLALHITNAAPGNIFDLTRIDYHDNGRDVLVWSARLQLVPNSHALPVR